MRKLILICALAGLLFATAGSAHPGNKWFQGEFAMQAAIKRKYLADDVLCAVPKYPFVPHRAHSIGPNAWDHWWCGIHFVGNRRWCFMLTNVTGSRWSDFYLTSYRPPDGCRPSEVRRR